MPEPKTYAEAMLALRRARERIRELENSKETHRCDECGCMVTEVVIRLCDECSGGPHPELGGDEPPG